MSLRATGERMPTAIHVVSPFCDLTVSAPSILASAASDPWLDRNALLGLAASYIDDADPAAPLISPIYADLSGLPPLLIHAAADEALRDDATRLAEAAQRGGDPGVSSSSFEDSVHSFVLFDFLPEARHAVTRASEILAGATNA